ncbi:hypothetical protein [Enterobacter wuhouensis]|uniref:hypothetical protein n=1 Tax=Enterobacter wuhouensis TaxID=2529381 RepID=UPI003525FB6E
MVAVKSLYYSLIISLPFILSGCDRKLDTFDAAEFSAQQQAQLKRIEQLEKQQQILVNNEKVIAKAVGHIDAREKASTYTELDPTQTRFFVLNNGSIGLAGRIISIAPTTDGSIIHISLVNLLSVPVANIGFQMAWGNERPKNKEALTRWQQLLFSTKMDSSIELLPGQWKDIDLTLKGVSPNNLKYLKMSINMDNLIFGTNKTSKSDVKKSKK